MIELVEEMYANGTWGSTTEKPVETTTLELTKSTGEKTVNESPVIFGKPFKSRI